MKTIGDRPATIAVWSLLVGFAALQVMAVSLGWRPRLPWGLAQLAVAWVIMLILAIIATRRIGGLSEELTRAQDEHRAVKDQIEQLQLHSEMLEVLAQSADVPLAFHSLAGRIAHLVPCDRVGLALLSEDGEEFQTYTARVSEEERRARPRPDVVFKSADTAIGDAVRSRKPVIINDTSVAAHQLDTNVAHSSGFGSALIIPLVSNERAVGTLNVVARRTGAFKPEHVQPLLAVSEILAMAQVAHQLQVASTKHSTMESMTELTLSVSAEINSALQTIVGHCDVMERGYADPGIQRDLATIVRQAQRISSLLDRMRSASRDRLNQAAKTMKQGTPEAL